MRKRKNIDQYRLLAESILPEGILDWFDLTKVSLEKHSDKNTIHIYLDENADTPDKREDLTTNGFTRESVFNDFPIRGNEVLLHVRRRRWTDENGENVMTDMELIQEHTRCSKEFAVFLKESDGFSPDHGALARSGLSYKC